MTLEKTPIGLPTKTVARSLVSVLKQGSSKIGLNEGSWFKFIDPTNLVQGSDERVLLTDYLNMWELVLNKTSDPSLGLKIGDSSSPKKTNLPMGRIGADLIARKMEISRQTLYRKLKREKASFLDLLEYERKNTATHLLANAELTMSEIAILLGFSEPKSFRRAFRRWQGVSPKAFRDRLFPSDVNE